MKNRNSKEVLAVKGIPREDFIRHYCKKPGHVKRNCRQLAVRYEKLCSAKNVTRQEEQSSDEEAMSISHAFLTNQDWVVDSEV
jgi:hypothetical protein